MDLQLLPFLPFLPSLHQLQQVPWFQEHQPGQALQLHHDHPVMKYYSSIYGTQTNCEEDDIKVLIMVFEKKFGAML